MRLRSVVPLGLAALLMVLWLSVRMWFGSVPRVWMISCVLGAWAPLGAGAFFHYVRAIAQRDDRVVVAWLVRALAMHCVLVWMLGFSDWLRGPLDEPPHWNADLGAPVALISFAPAFALAYATLGWLLTLGRRLTRPIMRPAMPRERHGDVMPFRGVTLVAAGAPMTRASVAPFAIGAAAYGVAFSTTSVAYWVLPATALGLAVATIRNHRALAPSVAILGGLALMLLVRADVTGLRSAMSVGVALPWLALAGLALYLGVIEAMLRVRPELAR